MEELTNLVERSRKGDSAAYTQIVYRFQDMAVGYAYSLVGNWQEAEDIAQEAFISAYYTLSKLYNPAAFPGWFRRIVFTCAHRILRGQHPVLVPLEYVADTKLPDPFDAIVRHEQHTEL